MRSRDSEQRERVTVRAVPKGEVGAADDWLQSRLTDSDRRFLDFLATTALDLAREPPAGE